MRDLSKYEKDYCQQPFDETHLRFRRIKLLEQIIKYPHGEILEISCGMRPIFKDFNEFEKLIIVEPSKVFFENAVGLLKDYPEPGAAKINFINDYFENSLEILDGYHLDFVILSNVLQEIEDVSTFLHGLHKICQENTIVHIVVPNAKSFHRLLAYEMGIIDSIYQLSDRNILLQQQRVFDLKSLADLLIKSGFSIVETGSSFIKPFTHQQMQDMLGNQIINEQTLYGLYKMVQYMPELGSELFVDCKIS